MPPKKRRRVLPAWPQAISTDEEYESDEPDSKPQRSAEGPQSLGDDFLAMTQGEGVAGGANMNQLDSVASAVASDPVGVGLTADNAAPAASAAGATIGEVSGTTGNSPPACEAPAQSAASAEQQDTLADVEQVGMTTTVDAVHQEMTPAKEKSDEKAEEEDGGPEANVRACQ